MIKYRIKTWNAPCNAPINSSTVSKKRLLTVVVLAEKGVHVFRTNRSQMMLVGRLKFTPNVAKRHLVPLLQQEQDGMCWGCGVRFNEHVLPKVYEREQLLDRFVLVCQRCYKLKVKDGHVWHVGYEI